MRYETGTIECLRSALKETPGNPDGPLVRVVGTHRLHETREIVSRLTDTFRFTSESHEKPDVVWALYPYEDGVEAARICLKDGGKLIGTLKGEFWHGSGCSTALSFLEKCDLVMPISASIDRNLRLVFPDFPVSSAVVPNGIHLPSDEIVPWDFSRLNRPVITTVSDHSFMLKSAGVHELPSLFWSGNMGTLVTVGSGQFSPKGEAGPNVIDLGHSEDVWGILAGSDAFVYNSGQDGLPGALMEAMVVGLPVAVKRHPWSGAEELVKDGETGLLYQGIYELEEILRELPERRDLGQSAAADMLENWTWQRAANEMRHALTLVLNR
jgi:glycosyltransferase involved in cell wall biosynthesis